MRGVKNLGMGPCEDVPPPVKCTFFQMSWWSQIKMAILSAGWADKSFDCVLLPILIRLLLSVLLLWDRKLNGHQKRIAVGHGMEDRTRGRWWRRPLLDGAPVKRVHQGRWGEVWGEIFWPWSRRGDLSWCYYFLYISLDTMTKIEISTKSGSMIYTQDSRRIGPGNRIEMLSQLPIHSSRGMGLVLLIN